MKNETPKYLLKNIDNTSTEQPKSECENENLGLMGWLCPRCGRGNSPFATSCPCLPMPPITVTC